MEPLVSVIVPVYNVEDYLSECIESVLNQSYKNLEIILVDDGATDNSGKICDECKAKDNRVTVIHKENGGLSDARNMGMGIAKGEYISFIDSDDFVSPYFIEVFIKEAINNKCDLVALKSATEFWDGEKVSALARDVNDYKVEYPNTRRALESLMYMDIETGAQYKLYKRAILNGVLFPIGLFYEDVATTYKAFVNASKCAIVDGNLYAYRKRKNSIIRQKFSEKKLSALIIHDQLVNDKDLIRLGLHDAAVSRGYSLLFSVYLQIPYENKSLRIKVWNMLLKDRKCIIRNKNGRKKNSYAAWVSYLGMNLTYFIGRKFGQRGSFT